MGVVDATCEVTGALAACDALGVPRASYYRWKTPLARRPLRVRTAPRGLAVDERAAVLAELHSPRFVDQAPAEVFATLLDEGRYLCSERTMYRILASEGEVQERRAQARRPAYAKPQG